MLKLIHLVRCSQIYNVIMDLVKATLIQIQITITTLGFSIPLQVSTVIQKSQSVKSILL